MVLPLHPTTGASHLLRPPTSPVLHPWRKGLLACGKREGWKCCNVWLKMDQQISTGNSYCTLNLKTCFKHWKYLNLISESRNLEIDWQTLIWWLEGNNLKLSTMIGNELDQQKKVPAHISELASLGFLKKSLRISILCSTHPANIMESLAVCCRGSSIDVGEIGWAVQKVDTFESLTYPTWTTTLRGWNHAPCK